MSMLQTNRQSVQERSLEFLREKEFFSSFQITARCPECGRVGYRAMMINETYDRKECYQNAQVNHEN